MKLIISAAKFFVLFLVAAISSVLGFFGTGKANADVNPFSGLSLGNSAYADHTTCGPGSTVTSTCINSESAGGGSSGCGADGDSSGDGSGSSGADGDGSGCGSGGGGPG
jgi:hypothetical protein